MRNGSTEYAIFVSFDLGMWSHNPLILERLLANPDLPIPVSFYYGDIDWMDYKAGHKVLENNMFKD